LAGRKKKDFKKVCFWVGLNRVGKSMNITKKLLLAFSLLILSLIGTNLIAVFSLSKIGNAQDYFQANILPSLDAMNKEMLKVTSIRISFIYTV
jgi:methyl-accepting chemotaxis protein